MKHTFSVVAAPTAQQVLLAGEFNNFQGQAMVKGVDGVTYTLDVDLLPGTYGYKFILDGVWTADPNATLTKLVNGVNNSAVYIPTTNLINNSTSSTAAVTASSSVVLAANPKRKQATFVNYGPKACFLVRGGTAQVGKGEWLVGNGGATKIDNTDLWPGPVSAICAGSDSTNLAIEEGTE